MNCSQARPKIDAYADGELEASEIPALEQHLRECAACAAALRNLQGLKNAVKQEALQFTAPAELRQRLREALPAVETRPTRSFWNWNWFSVATAGAAAVCLTLLVMVTLAQPSARQQLTRELVSGHVRSLMVDHVVDVPSSDQHTVKPWFNGKIDFSPPVRDLQEFPLLGGRLDYVGGRTVAALVFQRHKHVINLFIWPAEGNASKPAAEAPVQGFNLVHWTGNGMTFWAVSDLNEKELTGFADAFAAVEPATP
jgi:anti-sigma factor (TIGR02949 family)